MTCVDDKNVTIICCGRREYQTRGQVTVQPLSFAYDAGFQLRLQHVHICKVRNALYDESTKVMTLDLTTLTNQTEVHTYCTLKFTKAKARTTDKNKNKYQSAPAEPIQGTFSGIGSSTLTAL